MKAVPANIFKIYSVHCLNDPQTGDYSYLVTTTGGGLNYFSAATCPEMVRKFLTDHNRSEYCLFLDWHNYVVFAEPVPYE